MDNSKTKVTSTVCANCGGQLEIDTSKESIECPYCGTKFTVSDLLNESDAVRIEKIKSRTQKDLEMEKLKHEKEMAQKIENKEKKTAFKKSKFSKVLIIFAVISLLFCTVSFNDGKILSGIVALIQIGLFAGAWLMGMQIINEPKKGVRAIAAIVAFALIIPYFGLYNARSEKSETIEWKSIALAEQLPEPKSHKGRILINSDEALSLYIQKSSKEDYNDYIEKCKEKGYTVDADNSAGSYEAYNDMGYKLRLYYTESSKEYNIDLDAPISMAEIAWPNSEIAKLLPTPKSNTGNISWENSDGFVIKVSNTTIDDFKSYADECANNGFNINYQKGDDFYYADDSNGNHVSLNYEGNKIMTINAKVADKKSDTSNNSEPDKSSENENKSTDTSNANGVSAEFKAAMDSYEKFFDEYVAFMKKYSKSDGTDASLIADYAKYMSRYADTMKKFEAIQNDDMSTAEAAYYVEVQARITQKLLQVSQ